MQQAVSRSDLSRSTLRDLPQIRLIYDNFDDFLSVSFRSVNQVTLRKKESVLMIAPVKLTSRERSTCASKSDACGEGINMLNILCDSQLGARKIEFTCRSAFELCSEWLAFDGD